jgi:hypothetical protein
MKKQVGTILAAAVGVMFSASCFAEATPAASEGTVKCVGANSCKGTSACKTATNACKGQNSCKGSGFIMTKDEKECTDKGGKVEKHDHK